MAGADQDIWGASGANGGAKADRNRLAYLLQQGQDINRPNWAGCTPLHCAAPEASPEIVQFLLEHGANAHAATPYGLTPLHFASYYGRADNVALLLKHGANVQAKNHDGFTAKDKAVEGQKSGKNSAGRYPEVIGLLSAYEQGIRPNLTSMTTAPNVPTHSHSAAPTIASMGSGSAGQLRPSSGSVPQMMMKTNTQAQQDGSKGGPRTSSHSNETNYHLLLAHLEALVQRHRQQSLFSPAINTSLKPDCLHSLVTEVASLLAPYRTSHPSTAPSHQPHRSHSQHTHPVPKAAHHMQPSQNMPHNPSWPGTTNVPLRTLPHNIPTSIPSGTNSSTAPHSARNPSKSLTLSNNVAPKGQPAKPQEQNTSPAITPAQGQMVVFDAAQRPPADFAGTDFYTQQYHNFLETVKNQKTSGTVAASEYTHSAARMYNAMAQSYLPYSMARPMMPVNNAQTMTQQSVPTGFSMTGGGGAQNPAAPSHAQTPLFGGYNATVGHNLSFMYGRAQSPMAQPTRFY